MHIEWTKKATKDMRKLPTDVRKRIFAKITQYATDPASLANNVKALVGSDDYRLRVADYRVIYRVEGDTVTVMVVMRVRHRSEAYE
jgi:mRNA interferase RelE/StbE